MNNFRRKYYIIYEPEEGGGYIASAPAIPGCAVYGKTLKEAYLNIQQAIKECLEVRRKFHQKPPQEVIKQEVVKKLSFVAVR